MKILIATESFYPNISGVAVFSYNLAKMLAQNGHELYVIAPSTNGDFYFEKIDQIKIYRLKSRQNPWRKGHFISKAPFKKVAQIINEVKPDVIHLQDPAAISLATLLVARRQKIPVVVTNHFSLDYVVSYLKWLKPIHFVIRFILNTYLGWFYNRAQVLTCPSKQIADYFTDRHLKSKPIVISNGVDLGRFMPEYGDRESVLNQWKIPANKSILLYVGRLDVDKNIEILLRALPKVLAKKQIQLLLVGEGKIMNQMKDLVKELKIEPNVTFTGQIDNQNNNLPKIYQVAAIFINPCPIETQGIAVLEAMASGLPIVAANGGALPELIKDSENGYLFKSDDSADLAQKIIQILSDSKLAQKMGQKSLEIVEAHKVENTFKEFEKIYEGLKK